jgi:hypothetical protein
MMKSALALAALVGLVAALTAGARADCYEGGTPSYDDVQAVEIGDCWPTGREKPCFYASVEQNGPSFLGTYVGAYSAPRLGVYALVPRPGDRARFAALVALLRTARVYERDPVVARPKGDTITMLVDGHHFELTLYRCHTWLTIEVPNSEFSAAMLIEPRWKTLQPALARIVDSFAWHQRLAADERRDMRAVFSMGRTLEGP